MRTPAQDQEPGGDDAGSTTVDEQSGGPERHGGQVAGAGAESPAEESSETLPVPPARNRWRRELRSDIDPHVRAAFSYLRGLIAGDGRPHKEIAEEMAISPAEFTKRFSLSRENFPPWSAIAPVFDVLDRDRGPFLDRWGGLWDAPWTTATLTYHGELDRFPELEHQPPARPDRSTPGAGQGADG